MTLCGMIIFTIKTLPFLDFFFFFLCVRVDNWTV